MRAVFNKTPLTSNTTAMLPLGEIKPEGWLLEQLNRQAEGITGQLDKFWDCVNDECGWLGGSGDSWERAPYYPDGLVSLAYTLGDEALIKKAQRYIEYLIASQREDGWFGPEKNDDYWPLMICLKALYAYFTATLDKRVLKLMDGFFKYEFRNLSTHKFREWAVARGGDNIYIALKMYNITGQAYLLELCKRIKVQTLDWTTVFHTFPYMTPLSKSMPWLRLDEGRKTEPDGLVGEARPFYRTMYHQTHGVNIAMGLKMPGVISAFKSGFKEETGFKTAWEKLSKHHGTANGIFVCDEHINGNSPSAGTETCTVVETMFSLETLMDIGEYSKDIPDILEKIAYNALPAPFAPDGMSYQYLQQTNQTAAVTFEHGFYNNPDDSNRFMLKDNFKCCLANQHQGWPNFTRALWYATSDGGLSAVSYAPCTVTHVFDQVPVTITVSGDYPFKETVEIEITTRKPVEFPLYLRVPYWSENTVLYLPGGEIMTVRSGETACIREKWTGHSNLKLCLGMRPRITRWAHQSAAVELGPLLMALPLKEQWTRTTADNDLPAWDLMTTDKWNYALIDGAAMKVERSEEPAHAFKAGNPPVKVSVMLAPAEAWKANGPDAGILPVNPETSMNDMKAFELIPYGYTNLRIGQFPLTETTKE